MIRTESLQTLVTLIQSQSNATVDMCLTKLDLLLAIAREPGLSVDEYSQRTGLPASSTSWHINELREGRSGKVLPMVGLGLIEARPNVDDWLRHEIFLSRKGKLFIDQLLALTGAGG